MTSHDEAETAEGEFAAKIRKRDVEFLNVSLKIQQKQMRMYQAPIRGLAPALSFNECVLDVFSLRIYQRE